jgi:predicted dehydrogenase
MMTTKDKDQDPAGTAGVSRRQFVTTAAAAGAGVVIVPRHVLGRGVQAPSDTVNLAIVGIGGMGGSNARALMSQNIVAICDVDDDQVEKRLENYRQSLAQTPGNRGARPAPKITAAQQAANAKRPATDERATLQKFMDEQLPKVQRYKDYREMLDKQKDLDGLVVATPDHMHAPIALAAMDIGKHVYVQKPLCWCVKEARALADKEKSSKVVTQMGNQGHSRDDARLGYEYITSGAIGEIREVHVWTNRPLGYWPQGVPRPAPMPEDAKLPCNGKGV